MTAQDTKGVSALESKIIKANILLAEALIEAGQETAFYSRLDEAFATFLPECSFQVINVRPDWDTVRIVYRPRHESEFQRVSIALPESLLAQVIETGESRFCAQPTPAELWWKPPGEHHLEPPSAWIGVPIRHQDAVSVVLVFESYPREHEPPLSEEDFLLISQLNHALNRYVNAHLDRIDLLQVERKYQDILHNSPDVFFQLTPRGFFEFVSPNVVQLLGFEAASLVGKHVKNTTPIKDLGELLKQISQVKESQEKAVCRLHQTHADGTEIHVEMHLAPIVEYGQVMGIHGVVRNITAQVKMHEENTHLASYPQANPQPVLELDFAGKLLFQNKASRNLLAWLLLAEDQFERILPDSYLELVREMHDNPDEPRRFTKDLGDRFLQWTVIIPETGRSVIFYAADLTTMHQTELALTQAKERAEQGERIKDAFLDNISHEIRTPLNSLLGFIKVLEEEFRDRLNTEQHSYFDIINMSGNRISRSMRAILEISNLESGITKHSPERFDIYDLILELIGPYRTQLAAKGLELILDVEPGRGLLETDRNYLLKALIQIFENAITFTETGSIQISHREDSRHAYVTIRDSGEGMAPGLVDYIIQPFTQGSEGFSKRFQGLGLGLALVKRYAQVLNAELNLESTPGQGTSFTLKLHRMSENLVAGDLPGIRRLITPATGHRVRVLIVEDDAITQKLYEVNLQVKFQLFFAFTLEQAKRILRKEQIDLIILDLNLQDGEAGEDLIYHLQKQGLEGVPILIASSDPEKVDLDLHKTTTVAGILAKPFDYARMIQIIGELIGVQTPE